MMTPCTAPAPPRGFPVSEYNGRVVRAQAMMQKADLAALLLTTEPEVRYFTGFLTRFWESPTRPWYLIVPALGEPIAVIPSIGAALMGKTWISDIRTWRAPDLEDDGITLLADALREAAGGNGRIGVPSGHETHVRMPLADLQKLEQALGGGPGREPVRLVGDAGIMRELRLAKSTQEIEKIRHACVIGGRAFARVPEFARPGTALSSIFRQFQMLCLEEGADWVPYLAGGAGPDGYDDVISPATDEPLVPGDVMMLDTGLVWDGYFCDYDRNYVIGTDSAAAQSAFARLVDSVDAAKDLARPGNTAADLFHTMDKILTGGRGGGDAGRLGHGLGMQLTEWPSLIPTDQTVLREGMVLTLEPGIETRDGRILVHEENIVINAASTEFLSPPATRTIPLLI